MRLQWLFYCTVVGLAAAATVVLVLGDSGIVAYRQAATYRDRLAAGIEGIEAAHIHLQRQLARFQSDAETVRLAAREIGYYRPGETVVSVTEDRGRNAVAERGDAFDATYYMVGPFVNEPVPRSHGGAKTLPMGFSFGAFFFLVVTAATALKRRGQTGRDVRSRQRRGSATDRVWRRWGARGEQPRWRDSGAWSSAPDDARDGEMSTVTAEPIVRESMAWADVDSLSSSRRSRQPRTSEAAAERIASW